MATEPPRQVADRRSSVVPDQSKAGAAATGSGAVGDVGGGSILPEMRDRAHTVSGHSPRHRPPKLVAAAPSGGERSSSSAEV